MGKQLFLICPTDHIEGIIREHVSGDLLFVTSLGNAIMFETEQVKAIRELVEAEQVTSIAFVLADDNEFVQRALRGQQVPLTPRVHRMTREIDRAFRVYSSDTSLVRDASAMAARYLLLQIKRLQARLGMDPGGHIAFQVAIFKRHEARLEWSHEWVSSLEVFQLN